LDEAIRELFQLDESSIFKLNYDDEDGDLITIACDADVVEAVRVVARHEKQILRLLVTPGAATPRPSNSTTAVGDLREAFAAFGPQLQMIATELEKQLPENLESHLQHFATEFQSHPLRFMKQHMPAELKKQLKACGAMKFIKKAMKAKNSKGLNSKFLEDKNLPDGSKLAPGTVFSKNWRVANCGASKWPAGTRLQHVDGELCGNETCCAVPQLEPGQQGELCLDNIIAPAESGSYKSFWRLSTADGEKYGDRLWFDVSVVDTDGSVAPPVVHFGIICDATDVTPIVGLRYKKLGANYDLCEEAFEALSEDEKRAFVCIDVPQDAEMLEVNAQVRLLADDVFQLMQGGQQGQQAYDEVDACSSLPEAMQKFTCYEAQAEAACLAAVLQWPGIWCDQCNVTPLTGPRFMKQLENDTYDLCHGCFAGLCESEQTEFKPVQTEAEAEATRTAYQEEVAAKEAEALRIAAEEAEALRIAAEEAEALRIAAEEAEALRIATEEAEALRIAAEEAEALRIAAEEAALSAAEEQFPLEWQGSVDALIQMGFAQSVAQDTVSSAQGDLEAALEAALAHVPTCTIPADAVVAPTSSWDSEWDSLLMELVEMGFENHDANKAAIFANEGDLKSTVTALVADERANRR
jgi:hypothetical protein